MAHGTSRDDFSWSGILSGSNHGILIQTIFIFLLAVILVMAGTYLLFTAGSIVILKLLRKNKKFYYKTGNFISVSGMIYRMKQNAAGLASICILSTGVLLLLSMTVSLYFGMGDIMVNRYPFDTDARISGISQEQSEQIQKVFAQAIKNDQVPAEKTVDETYLEIGCRQEKNGIMIGQAYSYLAGRSVYDPSLSMRNLPENRSSRRPCLVSV